MDFEDNSWKEIYFKDNFSVDVCLSNFTQKSDLKTLRRELKDYGNELHNCMSEILKSETEDIIDLAEHLTNLKSKIDDLSLPLSQLVEEIRTSYDMILNTQECFKNHLDTIKSNSAKRNCFVVKSGLISTSSNVENILKSDVENSNEELVLLERAVNKYSFQTAYIKQLGLMSDDFDLKIDEIKRKLTNLVNSHFLFAVYKNDTRLLARCLRMYVNLNQQRTAENVYRNDVVRPGLKKIFTQKNLDSHNQDLKYVYQEAVNFVDTNMSTLLQATKTFPDLRGFDFVLNSFWTEADQQLRENLPNITAPGNPKIFQKCFSETWHFVKEIKKRCNNPKNVTFSCHMKRFNLAVYFEIRFQQIAANFENNISSNFTTPDCRFKLKITEKLLASLKKCFNKDIFLEHIADQILKLSMLLLSRYVRWFENYLQKTDSEDLEDKKKLLISGLSDFTILKQLIGSPSNHDVFSIVPCEMEDILVEFTQLNNMLIDGTYIKVKEHIISVIVNESVAYLQQVASIPRLYRRTNKNMPKEHSLYVNDAIAPMLNFNQNYRNIMTNDMQNTLDVIIARVTEQYVNLVHEVLSSVCKMEESLRRLKNRNAGYEDGAQTNSETISDEAKIREQIRIDVNFYVNALQPHAFEASEKAVQTLLDVTKRTVV